MKKSCSMLNCGRPHQAKGFCHKHYETYRRTGNPLGLRLYSCEWSGCQRKCKTPGYCPYHAKRKTPIGTSPGAWLRGDKNPNWKGGVAEYPNHGAFKKARKIVLAKYDFKCGECGAPYKHVHHKDLTNYRKEGLRGYCHARK